MRSHDTLVMELMQRSVYHCQSFTRTPPDISKLFSSSVQGKESVTICNPWAKEIITISQPHHVSHDLKAGTFF